MTTRELAAKVKLMRIAQATYFRHRDSEALDVVRESLDVARRLEREVDHLIDALLRNPPEGCNVTDSYPG